MTRVAITDEQTYKHTDTETYSYAHYNTPPTYRVGINA